MESLTKALEPGLNLPVRANCRPTRALPAPSRLSMSMFTELPWLQQFTTSHLRVPSYSPPLLPTPVRPMPLTVSPLKVSTSSRCPWGSRIVRMRDQETAQASLMAQFREQSISTVCYSHSPRAITRSATGRALFWIAMQIAGWNSVVLLLNSSKFRVCRLGVTSNRQGRGRSVGQAGEPVR